MNYLFITPTHVSARINGADWYDQLLAEELIKRGHNAVIMAQFTKLKTFNGVEIVPNSQSGKWLKWAECIMTRPQAATSLPLKGKNFISVQHNMMPHRPLKTGKVIYVAKHLQDNYDYQLPSMVLHPINRYKGAEPLKKSHKIALVNCNTNKGGRELIELAAMLPEMQFLGISGYGTQIRGSRPNIEYREPSLDLREVLHDVGAVVSFSKAEGYPMLPMEVQALGLPFFGSRIAGHLEVGLSAYFDTVEELASMLKSPNYDPLTSRPDPAIEDFILFSQKDT